MSTNLFNKIDDNKTMKVSIITVCKNAETAIERTMLSVVSQNCFNENIEYIVVDGASTDKTVEIIKQYSEKYPIKWISEPDSGIYNAMNKGIKMATGEYLLFLNAGDYLVHYNVIKSLMDLFESSEFDVIYGNAFFVNPISGKYYIKNVDEPLDASFFYHNFLPHQAIFYKKDVFEKFGGYDENFKIISDHVFNKKLLCDYKVSAKHIDKTISVFICDGISATNQNLHFQERKIFHEQYFTQAEISGIKKQKEKEETVKLRKEQKSMLRFLAKSLIKIHELWVCR